MSLFKKERADNDAQYSLSERLGISKKQLMSAVAMVTVGVAFSVVINGLPIGVKQAFTVSAEASYEEQQYKDFSPADIEVLNENSDVSVREFTAITEKLADMNVSLVKTAFDIRVEHLNYTEEPEPASEVSAAVADGTTVSAVAAEPQIEPSDAQTNSGVNYVEPYTDAYVDRTAEPVVSGNKNLYLSNYHYGASPLPRSGGARLNNSGIPLSELTLPPSLKFDENGAPLNYSYYIDCYATAYSSGPITSTGTDVYQGCVAVDPRIIPYGTEMWIVSLDGKYVYGYCRAEDTGGFIYFSRGATADLYMYSEADCVEWGFREARIYILPSSY